MTDSVTGEQAYAIWSTANAAGRALAGRDPAAWPVVGDHALSLRGEQALHRVWSRSIADAAALRLRYSDAKIAEAKRASGFHAMCVQDALEQVRVEALGVRHFPGCRANLEAYHALVEDGAGALRVGPELPEWSKSPIACRLAAALRARIASEETIVANKKKRQNEFRGPVGEHLDHLGQVLHDQAGFAGIAEALLIRLGLFEPAAQKDDQPPPPAFGNKEAEGEGAAPDSAPLDDAPEAAGDEALPAAASAGDAAATAARATFEAPAKPVAPYRIYTTAFDEVIAADQLGTPTQLAPLRARLDARIAQMQGTWPRLARQLQRRILAQRNWSWMFDLEEGMLDAARLARTIADPGSTLSFKQEAQSPFRDTVVTLLIDCSGSMRGEPIALAAVSAELLARALERCAVKVEVLGFTTRTWRGGAAWHRWTEHGKPEQPGRLAELRHIVFKDAAVPLRRARFHLAAMLRDDMLRENVDGEALLWAHQRLLARPEQRRILIVVSDGAPAEDATTSANAPEFLAAHLKAVTGWIEAQGLVELLAIGIGCNVQQFYQRAVTIKDASVLGSTLIDELTALMDTPSAGKRQPRSLPAARAPVVRRVPGLEGVAY